MTSGNESTTATMTCRGGIITEVYWIRLSEAVADGNSNGHDVLCSRPPVDDHWLSTHALITARKWAKEVLERARNRQWAFAEHHPSGCLVPWRRCTRKQGPLTSLGRDWRRRTIDHVAVLNEEDPRHGTTDGYSNHRCRCDRCRKANATAHAAYMARVRNEGRILGRHGTTLSYDSGCRCDLCREVHNKKSREYKRKRRQASSK